jgi:alpha-galactosidase
MRQTKYSGPLNDATLFVEDDGRLWLRRLCGLTCGNNGDDTSPSYARGPAILATSNGLFEGDDFKVTESVFDADAARIVWSTADDTLRLETVWSFCRRTGVVSRKDRLVSAGGEPITIFRIQPRFSFPSGRYEVYAQQSRWCSENQGAWLALHAGSLRLGCVQGRTTMGGTPYCCLREVGADRGLAFHVLPKGNWSIEVAAQPNPGGQDVYPYAVVSLGLADGDLRLTLRPGEAIECPEILIQSLPDGDPRSAAPQLHQWWQRSRHTPCAAARLATSEATATAHGVCLLRSELPVVFNTWFDQFEVLDVPRLRRQLQAAKEVGCEVFVIDAGWYGPQSGGWWLQAGDWRERTEAAFLGRMADFADEVRAAGLGFGLWMEPERFGPDVPVRREHPDWFRPGQPPFSRIDLENPAAYDYLRGEISRLVDGYRLAWMKIDFNFELGLDASGGELSGYYRAWYRLLDEIRAKHPDTVFEGCASGAMRLDLESLSHFDGHFLTDTVNPTDVVRIGHGSLLRLPPGELTRWAVIRSVGQTIPRYTKSLAESPVSLATPCGAIWEPAETVELDFAAAAAMPGILGLGGDLIDLPAEARTRLAEHIRFFKQWRQAIRRSVAHLLTPVALKIDREGWAAVQLSDQQSGTALLFVYRLSDGSSAKRFVPRGLDSAATYELTQHIPAAVEPRNILGADLMFEGIEVALPSQRQAAVFVLKPSR